jgi:small subunit ribosomal protein S2
LPVIALVDTNCDPDEADFVVPGNDDAIKACELVIRTMADAIEAGKQQVKAEEFEAAPAEETAAEGPEEVAVETPEPPAVEEEPAHEQLSQGESAEETVAAERPQEEVPAE